MLDPEARAGSVNAGPENLAELLALPQPPERIWWEKAGMELVLVPAGVFIMGSSEQEVWHLLQRCGGDPEWYLREVPRRQVHLSAYYVGRCPLTNEQYARFVKETGHRLPYLDPQQQPWAAPYNWDQGQKVPPQGREDHPVVLVSRDDAVAYCRWAGLRLPTEAEWEKAARGTDGRVYPWGAEWDGGRCNNAERLAGRPLWTYEDMRAWLRDWRREDPIERNQDTTTPVGRYSPAGDSPYGCADVAGNVWEWCADRYDGRYYQYSPLRDPQGPAMGTHYVLRGGGWGTDRRGIRCAYRYRLSPSDLSSHVGFRCAASAG